MVVGKNWRKNVYLKNEQEEEVGISKPPELLEKVKRQKSKNVVFGGSDGIVLKQKRETWYFQLVIK